MIEEGRIVAVLNGSGVKNVVLLDDAFDPPAFDPQYAGPMLQYVESEEFPETAESVGLQAAELAALKDALQKGEHDAAVVARTIALLYEQYRARRLHGKFDPGGLFKDLRSDSLRDIEPLLALLKKCDKLNVKEIGCNGEIEQISDVDVIFADYFLVDPATAMSEISSVATRNDALEASYDTVIKLVGKAPAGKRPSIVLMSSEDKSAEAEAYREKLSSNDEPDLIYSSSFAFMGKKQLTVNNSKVTADEGAADALLEIFQSFEFGRSLHGALDGWIGSAKTAVEEMQSEIAKLRVKDFAYLVKFRLMAENEGLLEYLEWFFGECLAESVSRAFDKTAIAQNWDPKIKQAEASRIEGAFNGPTDKIADLYHRVRTSHPRPSRTLNYRLGDMYVSKDSKSISAIMTPECDLILRKNKRKAKKLLVLGGELKALDSPKAASVSDFIRIPDAAGKEQSYIINWDPKDIETHFTDEKVQEGDKTPEHWPSPGKSDPDHRFVGTLKPIYAQELQRNMLVDLARPAMPLAPAIAMAATCILHVDLKGKGFKTIQIGRKDEAQCWVLLHDKKPCVVFARRAVTEMIKTVKSLNPAEITNPPVELKPSVLEKFYDKLCGTGVALDEACQGIQIATAAPKRPDPPLFAWLVIEGVETTTSAAETVN